MQTEVESTEEQPFLVAPSPWKCKGEFFWFLNYTSGSTPYPGRSSFGELEADSSYADPKVTGKFKGGLQHIMVVRYTETPVGPYDEIIWSPGQFDVPPTGKAVTRITRIYVSTKESIFNGRKNWNVPKHHAHFTFTPSRSSSPDALPYSRVAVALPSTPDKPFFIADLIPTMFLGGGKIPFNTKYFPVTQYIAHPPLPESQNWREDALVGTDRWCLLPQLMKGKAGFFRSQGGLEGGKYGDDQGFPDVKPWSLGMWMRDFELDFPVGEHLGKKDD